MDYKFLSVLTLIRIGVLLFGGLIVAYSLVRGEYTNAFLFLIGAGVIYFVLHLLGFHEKTKITQEGEVTILTDFTMEKEGEVVPTPNSDGTLSKTDTYEIDENEPLRKEPYQTR